VGEWRLASEEVALCYRYQRSWSLGKGMFRLGIVFMASYRDSYGLSILEHMIPMVDFVKLEILRLKRYLLRLPLMLSSDLCG